MCRLNHVIKFMLAQLFKGTYHLQSELEIHNMSNLYQYQKHNPGSHLLTSSREQQGECYQHTQKC